MRTTVNLFAGSIILLMASACNNPKSPETAAHDISAAHDSAAKEVAEARQDQRKDMSNDSYDVAVARADGDHKIAVQKCDTLEGHDQKVCKDQADADYDAAKANAKATKVSQQP
jgi:hypothetical protein